MQSDEKVSSKAVVKYEGPASIVSYTELAKDTDLNHPPSNWLRDNLMGKFPYRNARKTEPFDYSSLLMAGRYPEIIGEVDVVSGANMIKKLLKMPFSDSSLSMSVHRIGNTLLLNQLDIPNLLQSPFYTENENLTWLRDLYCEANGIPLNSTFVPKKRNKEQSQLQMILSKFMYHSIEGGATGDGVLEKLQHIDQASLQLSAETNNLVKNLEHKVVPNIQLTEANNLIESIQNNNQCCTQVGTEASNSMENFLQNNVLPHTQLEAEYNKCIEKSQNNYRSAVEEEGGTKGTKNLLGKFEVIPQPSISYDMIKTDLPPTINSNCSKPTDVTPDIKSNCLKPTDVEPNVNGDLLQPEVSMRTPEEQPIVASTFSKNDVVVSQNDLSLGERVSQNVPAEAGFSRDVLWTFEDITMLVGSDLPIFGGGKYPAVSLRLSDSSKPINILTGIDYWLDNLMCNVPELIMCFHLKGIVQKYEKIKTSDLPDIDGSSFSPKVIKDIAQNVLSFLKANCTKEGHTYWLFKSTKDDVIKLYDLTSICAEKTHGKQQDPFSVSVGVLLYNIARNMHKSGEINSRNICKIRSLLKNCITLLESKDRPDISLLANCLLIELYSKDEDDNEIDDNSYEDSSEEIYSTDDDFLENDKTKETTATEKTGEPITTVSLKTLGVPSKFEKQNKSETPIVVLNEETSCRNAILLTTNALRSLNVLLCNEKNAELSERPTHEKKKENNSSETTLLLHKQTNQDMLSLIKNDIKEFNLHNKHNVHQQSLTLADLRILLLEKAVEYHLTLINITIAKNKLGRALRFIQSCCYCLENAKYTSNLYNPQLTVEVLKLYGDVLTIMVRVNVNQASEMEDFYALSESDQNLRLQLKCDDTIQFVNINMKCIADCFGMGSEQLLNAATGTYEEAISIIGDDHGVNTFPYQMVDLSRRLGNIRNELGVLYMNKAASISNQYGFPSDQEMLLWKRSFGLYEGAIMSFKIVNDRPNMALLYLNCAKLMNLCAQVYGNSARTNIQEPRGPFTQEEKTYFNKSFEYYQKALSVLHTKESYPRLWTNVSLELSGAYFTMGITMQENHPQKSMTEEKVIKEISSSFMKALQYSESVINDCDEKQKPMVLHRMGSIHHRLASLYHHVLKNQVSDTGKKNYRSLSDLHYKKVYGMVQPNLFPMDIIRFIMDHIDFYDFVLKQAFLWKYMKLKLELFIPRENAIENSTLLLLSLQEVLKILKLMKQSEIVNALEIEEQAVNNIGTEKQTVNVVETEKKTVSVTQTKMQVVNDMETAKQMINIRKTKKKSAIVKESDQQGVNEGINIEEMKRIVCSLDNHLNSTLKEMIKFLSNKKNKKSDFIDVKIIKKMYEVVLRGRIVKDDNFIRNLSAFIEVLYSIGDFHTFS